MSFAQIQKSDKTIVFILGFVSYIKAKTILQSLLLDLESKEVVKYIIKTLRRYAFLSKREDKEIFDIYSLIHMTT